jgi:predicted metal-dependent hydrolase
MIRWIRVIRRRIRIIKRVKVRPGKRERKKGLLEYSESARALAHARLEYFNQFYNFKYGAIRIKSQITRWGSCSS